jgi:hypothetical protein
MKPSLNCTPTPKTKGLFGAEEFIGAGSASSAGQAGKGGWFYLTVYCSIHVTRVFMFTGLDRKT